MSKRLPDGTFAPGASGNPNGKPKGLLSRIRDQFSDDVPKILEVFRDLAIGGNPPGYSENEIKASDRIKAGAEVIDRVLGRPQPADDGDSEPDAIIDVSDMTDEQLDALASIRFVARDDEDAEGDASAH